MVKHLGYRIELADIEHAILSGVPEVKNVCVVYVQKRKEIIAYCEVSKPLNFQGFKNHLSRKVPAYMIPSRLEEIGEMPMNPNGKIDRLYFKKLAGE